MNLKEVKEYTEKIINKANSLLDSVNNALMNKKNNSEAIELDYIVIETEVYLIKLQLEKLESIVKNN